MNPAETTKRKGEAMAAKSKEIFGYWAEYDGRVVELDGLKVKIRCDVYTAKYPYEQEVISVSAEHVSKTSKEYRRVRQLLGDDWSTDVLESDVELQVDILTKLGHDFTAA